MRQAGKSRESLRTLGMTSLLGGAIGAMILMLRAGGRNRPLILVPLFAVWDISPFVLLWLADRLSGRWPVGVRTALYWLMVVVSIGTVIYYVGDRFYPRQAQAAYPYVIAPPVAWVLIAVVLTVAAVSSRET